MTERVVAPSALIVVEPPGAAWPHVETLVRELTGLGIEVTVAAIAPMRPSQYAELAGTPGVEIIGCPLTLATPADHLANRDRVAT